MTFVVQKSLKPNPIKLDLQHLVFICSDCVKRKQSHVDEELYSP